MVVESRAGCSAQRSASRAELGIFIIGETAQVAEFGSRQTHQLRGKGLSNSAFKVSNARF
jgi:hypothetical protein